MEVYLDGKFVPEEEAKVSVFDSGLLYGDGVFEGIRAYNGRVFMLKEHIDRLYDCAKAIAIKIEETKEEMCRIVLETCARNNMKDAYIRLVVTRGRGDMGLNPATKKHPSVICIACQITLYPEEEVRKGISVITAATRRNYGEVLAPQIKSLNYLPNIMARLEAHNAGAAEAICMSREGYVAECTGDNVFVVKDGVVKTPHPGVGILLGITRKAIFKIARDMGKEIDETFMNRFDLYTADELFVSGTAAEIVPVGVIDGRTVGKGGIGPVTEEFRKRYKEMVNSEGTKIPF
jgi:branched-chain amino acid aminotransferase